MTPAEAQLAVLAIKLGFRLVKNYRKTNKRKSSNRKGDPSQSYRRGS